MPQTINYDTISDKIILCSNSKNGNNMYFKINKHLFEIKIVNIFKYLYQIY